MKSLSKKLADWKFDDKSIWHWVFIGLMIYAVAYIIYRLMNKLSIGMNLDMSYIYKQIFGIPIIDKFQGTDQSLSFD
jgi:hypothetical protein